MRARNSLGESAGGPGRGAPIREAWPMAADVPSHCNKTELSASERPAAPDCDAPVIDLAHLARQTLGDQALEAELLALFENQAARITAQLTAPGAGDAKSRGDLAHTLRGSALAIGAGEVARAAQVYETACAAGSPGAALGDLVEAVARARAAIARRLGRSDG
jgi:HPt (histidine-containing phosphotransfer) domain-containing protein